MAAWAAIAGASNGKRHCWRSRAAWGSSTAAARLIHAVPVRDAGGLRAALHELSPADLKAGSSTTERLAPRLGVVTLEQISHAPTVAAGKFIPSDRRREQLGMNSAGRAKSRANQGI
ncbi:hypothetical protein SBA1_1100010 [Candidatus Sulfotelmatobacter kueseliae]|uniref:Uncharacterized protein n=1 Tax=Candidatus Sulfotelmatobacter kueseliae TaxID=2042962 RepID=A0A2U3JZV2_9BACT|nr:hypothetical protein SBA1_1100010 [Candidatus Sulfotelmatobacter kueseliae]